jgi:hypothetical protein
MACAVVRTSPPPAGPHGHGEVQPRLLRPAVVQVVAVVDDVDAANEGHLAIDHAQLLVQPAQLARQQPVATSGPAGGTPRVRRRAGQPAGAAAAAWPCEPKPSTTTRTARRAARAASSAGAAAGTVVVEDVGGQPDLGGGQRPWPRTWREQLVAALQQLDPVAAHQAGRGHVLMGGRHVGRAQGPSPQAGSSSATSGRWSDMRAQALPRGTMVERQAGRAGRSGRAQTPASATERSALRPPCRRGRGAGRWHGHRRVELLAPVVEVTGHHQHLARGRHLAGDEGRQALHLAHRLAWISPKCTTTACTVHAVPLHRHVQQARAARSGGR